MEETTLITIPRPEYNALLRAAQIVIGLSKCTCSDYDIDILIQQAEGLAKDIE